MRHLPPNKSNDHLSLRKLARDAGLPEWKVREFLWLINGHHKLFSFFLICHNLQLVLKELGTTELNCLDKYGIGWWPELIAWILINRTKIEFALGTHVIADVRSHYEHPMAYNGLSRNGIYAIFCNTHKYQDLQSYFNLLIGHLLLSHIQTVRKFIPLHYYETYDGQKEILYEIRPVYYATLGLRWLSETKDVAIFPLNPEDQHEDFIKNLLKIKFDRNERLNNFLCGYRNFIANNLNTKKSYKKNHNGKGRGEVQDGYVGLSSETAINIDFEDNDDPFDDWGQLELIPQYKAIANLSEDAKDALAQGVPIEELTDNTELALPESDCKNKRKGLGAQILSAKGKHRHLKMANQQLPWAYSIMSSNEVFSLLTELEKEFVRLRKKPDWNDEDHRLAETVALISIMFWTGSSLERSAKTVFISTANNPRIDLGLYKYTPDHQKTKKISYEWRVRTYIPEYADNNDEPKLIVRERKDYLYLPDIGSASVKFCAVADKNNKDIPNIVFSRSEHDYRNDINNFLVKIPFGNRLTIKKIENYFFARIATTTGNVSIAASITGRNDYLNNSRAHYFTPRINFLRKTYTGIALSTLSYSPLRVNNQLLTSESRLENKIISLHVGSKNFIKINSLKNAICIIKNDLDQLAKTYEVSFEAYHNIFTLYTILMFAYATGCRAVISPLIRYAEIDLETSLAVIADKDDEYHSKSRPIWLPSCVLEQIVLYEDHCHKLRLQLEKNFTHQENSKNPDSDIPCFFMNAGKTEEVKPSTVRLHLEKYLPVPANAQRVFMRTHLIEAGCPSDIIDAWMGHWHQGEEAWGKFSTLSYYSYVATIKKHIPPLLLELGFETISSILNSRNDLLPANT